MQVRIVIALALSLILAGGGASACGGDDDQEADVVEVTFNGEDTLTPLANSPLIQCAGAADLEPPSNAAGGIPQVYETQGPFSIMGETSGIWTAFSCEQGPDRILKVDGVAVIAGENGDEVFIRAHSEIAPPAEPNAATYPFTGHDLIIGGTGSLEGATGAIDVVGTVDAKTLVATDEFTGTITTVGSTQ
jgi:hypothetical protein